MAGHQGSINILVSRQGIYSYEVEVWHDELGKHRKIKASNTYLAENAAAVQLQEWAEMWQRKQDMQSNRESREELKRIAAEETETAKSQQETIANTLRHALNRNSALDWEEIKDKSPFPMPPPRRPANPSRPPLVPIPNKPSQLDSRYQPALGFLDKMIASRREQKVAVLDALYNADLQAWEKRRRQIMDDNAAAEQAYQQQLHGIEQEYARYKQAWEVERNTFLMRQREQHAAVDAQKMQYLSGDPACIAGYCERALASSDYPNYFPERD